MKMRFVRLEKSRQPGPQMQRWVNGSRSPLPPGRLLPIQHTQLESAAVAAFAQF
jgi:hypothetical protein